MGLKHPECFAGQLDLSQEILDMALEELKALKAGPYSPELLQMAIDKVFSVRTELGIRAEHIRASH